MKNYEYVSRAKRLPVKRELIEIFNKVQNELRDEFTFRYDFVGSEKLNMVTCDFSSNIGFDFEVEIRVNDEDELYSASEIKHKLMNAFNNVFKSGSSRYDYCEDSTGVLTIKVKDYYNPKIIHSCDIAIVADSYYGGQSYISLNNEENSYYWEYDPDAFVIDDKIKAIKENDLWDEVKKLYLEKKNNNDDVNKKSRSLRAEAINEVYTRC